MSRHLARQWLLLLIPCAVAFAWLSCECGDDDDNGKNGGAGDDDDASPPASAQEVIERVVSELDAAGVSGSWVAHVMPAPVSADVQVQPAEGESAFQAAGDYWFAFVDEDPFAWYEHDVKFVFIDAASGEMTVESQSWWPEVNGEPLTAENPDMIKVFAAAQPEWRSPSAAQKSSRPLADAPHADYGDAPDNTGVDNADEVYYGGAIAGRFPTRYATDNAVAGRPGGHTLTVGQETLGAAVSAENDVIDQNDPDGAPNLVDNDRDDRLFWVFFPNVAAASLEVSFLVNVTVAAGLPEVDRYLNVAADVNRDGAWKRNAWGPEWLVENEAVKVPPGQSEWIWTGAIDLPVDADRTFGYESWLRVALTREAIDGTPFGEDGWDGSGEFAFGEIEDHYFNFEPWPGDDDDDGGLPRPKKPEGVDPGPGIDPKDCAYTCLLDLIDIPINCKALVINFGDRRGESHVTRDANKAVAFYQAYLGAGNVTVLPQAGAAAPTAAEALAAIRQFLAQGQCLDELHLYLAGHGGRSGYIRAQNGRGRLTPKQLKDAIAAAGHCPASMDYYTDGCRGGGYCNLNVFIQSCYAGNFTKGANAIALDGVNVVTASDDDHRAHGAADGDGGYVSDAYFDAFTDGQADQAPWGNGDGVVTPEEAAQWAKDNYGGPNSGAAAHAGADCECACNSPGWYWDDPEDDLIYWESKASKDPLYVGHLDILHYGLAPTAAGFDALISVAADLPLSGAGWCEYYAVFDIDDGLANGYPGSPTHDGDTAYVPFYYNGAWDVSLFQNDGAGNWLSKPTTATIDVSGADLVIHIDPTEEGIDLSGPITPAHMATWYAEGGYVNVGDDTAVQTGAAGQRCF